VKRACSIDGCGKPVDSFGWCEMHYSRWRRHGDPLVTSRIIGDDLRRFWSKVNKDGPVPECRPELGPCWLWTAGGEAAGYGEFTWEGKTDRSHVAAYVLLVGPVPDGLVLDHLCQVKRCVKAIADGNGPAHLEPVPQKDNILRGTSPAALNAQKTHCRHDHEFTVENTLIDRNGHRRCRACSTAREMARRPRSRSLAVAS
jgi:hypothetical protein